jgi:hypothetical protein
MCVEFASKTTNHVVSFAPPQGYNLPVMGGSNLDNDTNIIDKNSNPICSTLLEYLPTFAQQITQSCR